MTPAEVKSIVSGLRSIAKTLALHNRGPVPFVLADGVCPVCFDTKGEHVNGCPRAATSEEIGIVIP